MTICIEHTLSNLKLLNMVDLGYLPFICENRKFSLSLSLSLCTLLDSEAFWSFFYFWFGFLRAQVSYGNCERTET